MKKMTKRLIKKNVEGKVKIKFLSIEIYIVIRDTNISGKGSDHQRWNKRNNKGDLNKVSRREFDFVL